MPEKEGQPVLAEKDKVANEISLTIYPVFLPIVQLLYDSQLKKMTEKVEIKFMQRIKYFIAVIYIPFIVTAFIF